MTQTPIKIKQMTGKCDEINIKLPCSFKNFKQECIGKNILTDMQYKFYYIYTRWNKML